jgi:hypothetical protein
MPDDASQNVPHSASPAAGEPSSLSAPIRHRAVVSRRSLSFPGRFLCRFHVGSMSVSVAFKRLPTPIDSP